MIALRLPSFLVGYTNAARTESNNKRIKMIFLAVCINYQHLSLLFPLSYQAKFAKLKSSSCPAGTLSPLRVLAGDVVSP